METPTASAQAQDICRDRPDQHNNHIPTPNPSKLLFHSILPGSPSDRGNCVIPSISVEKTAAHDMCRDPDQHIPIPNTSKLLLDELSKVFNEDEMEGKPPCDTCTNLILKLHKHVLKSHGHGNRSHTSAESGQINSKRSTRNLRSKKRLNYSEQEVEDPIFILPHKIQTTTLNSKIEEENLPATVTVSTSDPPIDVSADIIDPEIKIEVEDGMDYQDYSELAGSNDCEEDEEETNIELNQSTGSNLVSTVTYNKKRGKIVYPCRLCEKKFTRTEHLKLHFKQSHPGEWPYACGICNKTFAIAMSLNNHTRTHTGEKPFHCETCGKNFARRKQLTRHKLDHGPKPYVCEVCGKNYKSKLEFDIHTKSKHTGERPHKCTVCGKAFVLIYHLNYHMAAVHTGSNEKEVICEVCAKSFKTVGGLNYHMMLHTGEKSFACEVCGKEFYRRIELVGHMTVHSDERALITCEVCGKSYKRKPSLVVHKRTHTGERPYLCTICNQTFKSAGVLGNHRRSHGSATPYVCQICKKAFKTNGCLLQHKRVHKKKTT